MENNNADSGFQTRMEMQTAFLERQLQELNETVLELNRRVDRAEKRRERLCVAADRRAQSEYPPASLLKKLSGGQLFLSGYNVTEWFLPSKR